MKKITLLIMAVAISLTSIAQQPNSVTMRAVDLRNISEAPLQTPSVVSTQRVLHHPALNHRGHKSLSNVTAVQIGTAANILTVYQGENNLVAANDGFSTVVFIHRNNPSLFPLTSSQYRYDISVDEGSTFTTEIGPLNPSADGQVGGINGRYPQTVLHNPVGNTVRDSMYGAYFGYYHNGASTADTWEGTITGVYKIGYDPSTWTETTTQQNGGDVNIGSSLCNGLPGQFWAIDWEYQTLADSVLLVYKGVWNSATHNVDWTIAHTLNPGLTLYTDTTFNITPLIAFDPTGMKGWIAFAGDIAPNTNRTYWPVFYKTTDGGVTWTGPIIFDLTQHQEIMTTMDASGSGIPTVAFQNDLVVDVNGNPHYANVVSSGTDHSIEIIYKKTYFDFTYNSSTGNWYAIPIDTMQTFRGNICTDGASANYITDNRPQLSLSPGGDRVFYFWSDTDPQVDAGNNTYPDFIGRGYAVNQALMTPTTNFTSGDPVWGSAAGKPCAWPCTAPTAFRNAADNGTCIPSVITGLNSSQIGIDPCTFYYFNNICFDDASFTVPVLVSVPEKASADDKILVFPNPAKDDVTLSYTNIESKKASVTVVDILGKTVKNFGNNFSGFARYNIRDLDAGIYFFSIKTADRVITQRFEIAK